MPNLQKNIFFRPVDLSKGSKVLRKSNRKDTGSAISNSSMKIETQSQSRLDKLLSKQTSLIKKKANDSAKVLSDVVKIQEKTFKKDEVTIFQKGTGAIKRANKSYFRDMIKIGDFFTQYSKCQKTLGNDTIMKHSRSDLNGKDSETKQLDLVEKMQNFIESDIPQDTFKTTNFNLDSKALINDIRKEVILEAQGNKASDPVSVADSSIFSFSDSIAGVNPLYTGPQSELTIQSNSSNSQSLKDIQGDNNKNVIKFNKNYKTTVTKAELKNQIKEEILKDELGDCYDLVKYAKDKSAQDLCKGTLKLAFLAAGVATGGVGAIAGVGTGVGVLIGKEAAASLGPVLTSFITTASEEVVNFAADELAGMTFDEVLNNLQEKVNSGTITTQDLFSSMYKLVADQVLDVVINFNTSKESNSNSLYLEKRLQLDKVKGLKSEARTQLTGNVSEKLSKEIQDYGDELIKYEQELISDLADVKELDKSRKSKAQSEFFERLDSALQGEKKDQLRKFVNTFVQISGPEEFYKGIVSAHDSRSDKRSHRFGLK